ncbi:hypothetical protein EYF80_025822 [Liparis tanakae]|uniref:Uncharacterized protein n=1 Tax=Liparis tanakae TaxID=230148 RepID=A0A4Z2HEJ1_9TELE|nr:hypothetical protein EYF80_025822 [Liparis tanakae]
MLAAQPTAKPVSLFSHCAPTHSGEFLPFSISFLMASSVKAAWAASPSGNMLILLIALPLHLIVMLPGRRRGKRRMMMLIQARGGTCESAWETPSVKYKGLCGCREGSAELIKVKVHCPM